MYLSDVFKFQFIKENEDKRKRTQRKLTKKTQILEMTTKNVENLKQECINLEEIKILMDKDLEKLEIYKVW